MTALSTPLSSSAFLGQAISNYRGSTQQIALSTARLSSGSRITRAGDDVAAMSIASRMQGDLVAMRQANSNIAQGSSMLQIAYDALSNIGDILDRMQALSTQANSASLTTVERGFLQTEFTALSSEIDRIAGNTSFNDINVLDGTLSGQNTLTGTTTAATKASASLVFSSILTTNTVILNGVTLTADTQFAVGGSLEATIDNLVEYLNDSTNTALSGATYAKLGTNTLTITQDAGGTLGNLYYVDQGNSSATFTTSGTATAGADVYTLAGGLDNGLNAGSVTASGTIGDALVTSQSQTAASTTIAFSGNATNGESFTIDDGNGSVVTFTFVAAAATSTQITIGADVEESLTNAISKIEQYSGADDFGIRSLDFRRDGSNLIISNKQSGNPLDYAVGAALNVTETITAATISSTTLNNGTNTGVNTTGITNKDFIGSISGFTATYNSADNIDVSVTVGDSIYSATISDTTPVAATFARFHSSDGGYFDVEIAAGGLSMSDQDDANTFAARLNTAFGGLTFAQERNLSSFSGTGDLAGASATIQNTDFTSTTLRIRDVIVQASSGSSDAEISFDINGETYSSGNIDTSLGAYETITLTSATDSNNKLTITLGSSAVDLSSQTLADAFEEDLRDSFGLNTSGSGTSFQVGSSAGDTIRVSIDSAYANQLFGGVTASINTQVAAAAASDTITTARNSLNAAIANVGVLQERFEFAATNNSNTITGLDAARSNLEDTDIVEESTLFAQASLRNSAAVAIIAQASKLQSNLLNVLNFD